MLADVEGENLSEQKHYNDSRYGSPVMLRKNSKPKIQKYLALKVILGDLGPLSLIGKAREGIFIDVCPSY